MSETSSQMESSETDLIASYFLNKFKTLNLPPQSKEMEEKLPTELDTVKISGGFSVVGPDKLSVSYPHADLHGHDVGVVQANFPAPSKRMLYYFELNVKNGGAKGQIAIGFTPPSFILRRQPGWEAHSIGYHGDDGLLYSGHGSGEKFGPTFSTGDTVGGGINYAAQEFFFTKNGFLVGSVSKDVMGPMYPTVSLHSQNEELTVNFGKEPFVFDLKAYEAECREKEQLEIDSISISQDLSHRIVRSYLQHFGYEETLNLLDAADESNIPPILSVSKIDANDEDIMYAMNKRSTLRQLIMRGEIDETFSKLQEWYQIAKDDTSTVCFLLHCQKFIELVRVGELEKAVLYGRSEFVKFEKFPKFDDLVKDCAALLAYTRPQDYPVGYLLKKDMKELLADAVNAKILSMNPNLKDANSCTHSVLERLLRQLGSCHWEKRFLNGSQGEEFNLLKIITSQKNG